MADWVDNRKTICVDFNGVLDTYVGWRGKDFMYPMRKGADFFLKTLNELGYKVVIMTASDPLQVTDWLIENNISQYVAEVTDHKIPAIIYIDDRAIEFRGDFQDTLYKVRIFKTYWENVENHEGGKV